MTKYVLSLSAAVALLLPGLATACPKHASAGGESGCACDHAAKADKPCCDEKAKTGACPCADADDRKACCAEKSAGAACACKKGEQAQAGWKEISIDALASLQGKEGQVTVVDVNSDDLRKKAGVIPGAVLLSSSSQYELSELPAAKDGKLVFYCANTRCTAAPQAAARAIEAGYSDVHVLSAGIMGWKEAGKPTSQPQS